MKKTTSRKWLALFMTFIVILSCSSIVLATGLEKGKDNNYHYVQSDGSYLKNSFKKIGNKTYYFDGKGNMATGWKTIKGSRYYFDKNGVMATGTMTVDKKVRQFGKDGKATVGWKTVDGKTYYYTDGAYATGWKTIDGYKYYFGNDGGMRTGWQVINGKTYFLYKSGKNTKYPTKSYVLYSLYKESVCEKQPESTAVVSRFCYINGNWYYFSSDGSMLTGLQWVDEGWHIFDSKGRMCFNNSQTINGIKYDYVGLGKYLPAGYRAASKVSK